MARRAQWTFAPDKRKQAKPKVSAGEKVTLKERADTEEWVTIQSGQSADECFQEITSGGWFTP